MKQTTKNWLGVAALVFGSSAVTVSYTHLTLPTTMLV